MLEIICHETNRYTLHKGEQGTWIDVIPIEIRENFGLLLLSGRKEPLYDMLKKEKHCFQRPVFTDTMSRNRFKEIVFDDFRTRAEDKAASTTKCRLPELHLINWALCLDEQLLPFRGRCPFKVYNKSKPHPYGIKIWALCDTAMILLWYNRLPKKDQGRRVMLDLAQGLGRGCGVTTDNFFTSLAFGRHLLSEGKTLTGTIRWMHKEVPLCMQPKKTDALHSSSCASAICPKERA
ncbi:hypothetical protein T4B_2739 [Trichinella pseudospiralis]|uniref:PiggyBac transposable element-derived protein domain-containing protein n=1 Tax=Trichinella pseudospiralis TaxID=6337 RepID=A0A0V1JHA3_TRIPS|nr:hypothetical protein T4B_2739 [Trichinella pseudospiralis]